METLYRSLPCDKRDIRLLRISSRTGEEEEGIYCDLRVHDLDDETFEFKALSYCWGEDEASKVIYINGVPYHIRPNLHEFLLQFIEDNHASWIFVDAICINQNDVAEKSRQVPLMGDVYRNASEVEAWPGVRHNLSDAMKHICIDLCNLGNTIVCSADADLHQCRMMGMIRQVRSKTVQGGADDECRELIHLWCKECEAALGTEERFCFIINEFLEPSIWLHALLEMTIRLAPEFRIFLDTFCMDKNWSRLWVVQEMVLARKLKFRIGALNLDWRALLLFLHIAIDAGTHKTDLFQLETRKAWDDSGDIETNEITPAQHLASTGALVPPISETLYEGNLSYITAQRHLQTHKHEDSSREMVVLSQALLSWKRLMQHEARGRRVLLYEALLGYGLQQCSVPHDASYALLGLARSRLKVDYEMPLLELRIRTLIDTLQSTPQGNHSSSESSDVLYNIVSCVHPGLADYGYLPALVIVGRVSGFGWDFAKRAALSERYSADIDGLFARFGRLLGSFISIVARRNKKHEFMSKWWKLDLKIGDRIHDVRTWMILCYLGLCERFDLPLNFGSGKSECPPGLRTYRDWVKYVDEIAENVNKREFV